jgi:hypothetical protein
MARQGVQTVAQLSIDLADLNQFDGKKDVACKRVVHPQFRISEDTQQRIMSAVGFDFRDTSPPKRINCDFIQVGCRRNTGNHGSTNDNGAHHEHDHNPTADHHDHDNHHHNSSP